MQPPKLDIYYINIESKKIEDEENQIKTTKDLKKVIHTFTNVLIVVIRSEVYPQTVLNVVVVGNVLLFKMVR